LLIVFAGGSHCLWCPKSEWNPLLDASVALKMGKNGLNARKLQRFKIGGVDFYRKFLIVQLIVFSILLLCS
jgi:hypothetical protein